jgi:hypothetical protein
LAQRLKGPPCGIGGGRYPENITSLRTCNGGETLLICSIEAGLLGHEVLAYRYCASIMPQYVNIGGDR